MTSSEDDEDAKNKKVKYVKKSNVKVSSKAKTNVKLGQKSAESKAEKSVDSTDEANNGGVTVISVNSSPGVVASKGKMKRKYIKKLCHFCTVHYK